MTQDITVIHEAVKNIGAANNEVRTSGFKHSCRVVVGKVKKL